MEDKADSKLCCKHSAISCTHFDCEEWDEVNINCLLPTIIQPDPDEVIIINVSSRISYSYHAT